MLKKLKFLITQSKEIKVFDTRSNHIYELLLQSNGGIEYFLK